MLPAAEVGEWVPLVEASRVPQVAGVYIIRNTVNGKCYVGKSFLVRNRLRVHSAGRAAGYGLASAIRKHGVEMFECCLHLTGARADLPGEEIRTIAEMGTMAPAGYNLTLGGEGATGTRHSEATRARIKAALTGQIRSTASRARIGASKRGTVLSEEHKKKIGDGGRGLKRSNETRAKLSAASTGKPKSRKAVELLAQKTRHLVLVWPCESMVPLEFRSKKAAAEYAGVDQTMVGHYCEGRHQHRLGWAFASLK